MSENINDSKEEAVVAEEVTEAPVEAVAEVVEEAPVVETPAEEPAKEEKPKAEKKAKPAANESETVALYAKNNVNWTEVGKLTAGYNIVSKQDAEKWLTVKNVRVATPEEIAAKAAK